MRDKSLQLVPIICRSRALMLNLIANSSALTHRLDVTREIYLPSHNILSGISIPKLQYKIFHIGQSICHKISLININEYNIQKNDRKLFKY